MHDEIKLLNRVRALDQDALAEVHNKYYTSIYRYIAFRVNDSQTAEDLTSEVFLRLLSAVRDKSAPQKTLRGWLYGVASHVLKEHYRKKKRDSFTILHEDIPSAEQSLDQQIADIMQNENLQALMKSLTDDQQNVLALRFGFGMPIQEVAHTMGKSEGSVKMLQARAIAAISQRIMLQGVLA
ncbi:sigma-70 family RNA polymerase sigma factor [Candidatus Leptofilum sp.]|uniref:sigma-70 family RNA polymerase sigma factor n=1 Tax=Candidatus Leptofilum sp. TaxID=3241576 RepID=UPI003B5A4129